MYTAKKKRILAAIFDLFFSKKTNKTKQKKTLKTRGNIYK